MSRTSTVPTLPCRLQLARVPQALLLGSVARADVAVVVDVVPVAAVAAVEIVRSLRQ